MIEITPAILTADLKSFEMQISELFVFPKVDIDICRQDFAGNTTLQISEISNFIQEYKDVNFGIHLMVTNPLEDLNLLTSFNYLERPMRIYLHQESNLEDLSTFNWPAIWSKCICLKVETELKSISFYSGYDEIQLMTVDIGKQGSEFHLEVLDSKVRKLIDMGYKGIISIDGGVDVKIASRIKQYPINRVSVGSYFAKTSEDLSALKILNTELNS